MSLQLIYNSKGKSVGVFIPINDWRKITQKYKELDDLAESPYTEPSKQEILNSIEKGMREVALHQKGKLKLKTLKVTLDEL